VIHRESLAQFAQDLRIRTHDLNTLLVRLEQAGRLETQREHLVFSGPRGANAA
jgi:hypothetical protein